MAVISRNCCWKKATLCTVGWVIGRTMLLALWTKQQAADPRYLCAGLKRRSSSFNHPRLEHIMEKGEFNQSSTALNCLVCQNRKPGGC